MQPLQNKYRPISIGEAFIQDRDARIDDKDDIKKLIVNANSVNILDIFKHYTIPVDEYNRKCICPFSTHANERTGSFVFYKDTNSFYCFGCKNGGGPVNFVCLMENVSKIESANKITDRFYTDPDVTAYDSASYLQRQHILISFSEFIRKFIFDNLDDSDAFLYAEKVGMIFDTINFRHQIDNGGLESLVRKLKLKIEQYKTT